MTRYGRAIFAKHALRLLTSFNIGKNTGEAIWRKKHYSAKGRNRLDNKYIRLSYVESRLEVLRDRCGNEDMAFALNWALRLIKDTPQDDLVTLICCKDCIHHDAGENECESWNYCKILGKDVSDDWFCKSGKKKFGE